MIQLSIIKLLTILVLAIAGLGYPNFVPMAFADNWRDEPVFIRTIGPSRDVAGRPWFGIEAHRTRPYRLKRYFRVGGTREYGYVGEPGDPIAWHFRPGAAPGTYAIVGRPTRAIAPSSKIRDYSWCIDRSGLLLLVLSRLSTTVNELPSMCLWKVEDYGDRRIRLRSFGMDTHPDYGPHVGHLDCIHRKGCDFDQSKGKEPEFEYSAAIPCENDEGWVTGTVINFQSNRGFGTIRQDFCGAKVFVHASNIEGGKLTVGQQVKFVRVVGRDGPAAERVSVTK